MPKTLILMFRKPESRNRKTMPIKAVQQILLKLEHLGYLTGESG